MCSTLLILFAAIRLLLPVNAAYYVDDSNSTIAYFGNWTFAADPSAVLYYNGTQCVLYLSNTKIHHL